METIKINDLLNDIVLKKERKELSYFINLLNNSFPLLDDLKNAEQDKIWHAEGNVFIHTQMVLNSLYDVIYCDSEKLSLSDKKVLILSVIFHDIYKFLCNKSEVREGVLRVLSPNHEDKGANYISSILIDTDLNYSEILTIINLVKYHQHPKMLIIKNKINKKFFYDLASKCALNLIWVLCVSDIKGRICEDKNEQLDYLELFKIYATEEYNLFYKNDVEKLIFNFSKRLYIKSKEFKIKSFEDLNSFSLYHYLNENIYSEEEGIAKYLNIQNNSKVIVFSGISGAGKSFNSSFFNDFKIINLDEIRKEIFKSEDNQSNNDLVVRVAYEKLKEHLRKKENVLFDATNLRKDFRTKIYNICSKYNALVELYFFHTSVKHSINNQLKRTRKIDEVILHKQLIDLQFPSVYESGMRTKYIKV